MANSSASAFINSIRFNFLYVDRYSFGRTWVYPESMIPYNMLRYIVDGRGEFIIDNQKLVVERGQSVYIPQGCHLACRALDDNLSFISIRFTTSVRYEGADFLSDYYRLKQVIVADEELKYYYEQIYSWAKTESMAKIFRIRGYLELIIAASVESRGPQGEYSYGGDDGFGRESLADIKQKIQKSTVNTDPRIQLVIDYMVNYPTEKYTTEALCEMAELGQTAFRKLFKQQTGKTPTQFVRDLRLTAAARKLLLSSDPVSTIAYDVGFEDPNHFIRVFKKAFGLSPNQYRSTARE